MFFASHCNMLKGQYLVYFQVMVMINKKINISLRILVLGIVFFVFTPLLSFADSKRKIVEEANKLYSKKQYKEAVEKYKQVVEKDPESDIINFDIGTGFYKDKDYVKAAEYLHKALLTDKEELKQKVYYNLGNTLYQDGISREENADTAIFLLQRSLEYMKTASDLKEEDQDAKYNYEFIKKELQRLRKKKKEEQQDNNQNKENQQEEQQQPPCPFPKEDNKTSQGDQKQDAQQQEGQEDQKNQAEEEKGQDAEAKKEDSQSQENQSGQQQQEAVKGQEGESSDQKREQSTSLQGLNEKEAKILLEKYQQSEEPKGLLNFYRMDSHSNPVLKDW